MLSLCFTTYNVSHIVEESMESIILPLIKSGYEFELSIVDNLSTDDTTQIIRKIQKKYKIEVNLYSKKCVRGVGRQEAVNRAKGDYVIIGMDLDQVYSNDWISFIDEFFKEPISPLFAIPDMAWASYFAIMPKDLALKNPMLPVNIGEDLEYKERIYKKAKCRIMHGNFVLKHIHGKMHKNLLNRLRNLFYDLRDHIVLGYAPLTIIADRIFIEKRNLLYITLYVFFMPYAILSALTFYRLDYERIFTSGWYRKKNR